MLILCTLDFRLSDFDLEIFGPLCILLSGEALFLGEVLLAGESLLDGEMPFLTGDFCVECCCSEP